MKKAIIAIGLVALLGGLASAQPADVTADVAVSVTVRGIWALTLSTATVAYPDMDPGQTDNTQAVVANVRTNQNLDWYMKIHKDQDLTDAISSEVIPSANFTYAGSGGAGAWTNGEFPAAATTCYDADATEIKVMGAGLNLTTTYTLAIPADQTAGTYTNTITYTLTVTP